MNFPVLTHVFSLLFISRECPSQSLACGTSLTPSPPTWQQGESDWWAANMNTIRCALQELYWDFTMCSYFVIPGDYVLHGNGKCACRSDLSQPSWEYLQFAGLSLIEVVGRSCFPLAVKTHGCRQMQSVWPAIWTDSCAFRWWHSCKCMPLVWPGGRKLVFISRAHRLTLDSLTSHLTLLQLIRHKSSYVQFVTAAWLPLK